MTRSPPPADLVERDAALGQLRESRERASAGAGSLTLISGEAGVGKSSLIRAFLHSTDVALVDLRIGACDDLVTPRVLGAIRDAFQDRHDLSRVLHGAPGQEVPAALLRELRGPTPTVLVIEDLHWADEATVDVLSYLARRIDQIPVLIVASMRDDTDARPVLRRFLGALSGPGIQRLTLTPLTQNGLAVLARRYHRQVGDLYRLTGGNPFFATAILEEDIGGRVPASVSDVVLARLDTTSDSCRAAVEQLSVIPSAVDFAVLPQLLPDDPAALIEAERRGLITVGEREVRFRHELVRRAVEVSLPSLARRELHARVVRALQHGHEPSRARLAHHARLAQDAQTICDVAPAAAREAASAGAHQQALEHFTSVLPHAHLLDPAARAHLIDDHAWELYNARQFDRALRGSETAVRLFRELTAPVPLGTALVRLSRHRFMLGDSDGARAAAREAVALLDGTGDLAACAYARTYLGAVLALAGEPTHDHEGAEPVLIGAQHLAEAMSRSDLIALCLNYRAFASLEATDDERIRLLHSSLDLSLSRGCQEESARGYTNLAELLYRLQRLDELEPVLRDGLDYVTERGFSSHAYNLEVHCALLQVAHGAQAAALASLERLEADPHHQGMLVGYSRPWVLRLRMRAGDEVPMGAVDELWQTAQRQNLLLPLAFAGAALVEWSWRHGRPETAAEVARRWQVHARRPTAGPAWTEIRDYAARAGVDLDSLPPPVIDLRPSENGPAPPAPVALPGRRVVPTGAAPTAGLTRRQQEVLELLTHGLTNAEIAEHLVVSVRTVDAHVSAVLARLGVATRRQAAATLRTRRQH